MPSWTDEPATPYLVVDVSRLEANLAAMSAHARHRGLALRPHVKTHKCPVIARRQLDRGAVGLTVATVSEAEAFAAAGFTDLFVAYPLWVTPGQGHRISALLDRAALTVGVDSPEGAQALAAQVVGHERLLVLVEVDSGHHRSGVSPDDAGSVAAAARDAGLDVAGVFTFPGHGYRPGSQSSVGHLEAEALGTAAALLVARDIEPRVVSGGSTPTADHVPKGAMNELRPGVYVFGDAQQWELGTIGPEDLALTCRATVVSTAGGRIVVDSGSKVLGADRLDWATGYGRLLHHPDARVTLLSEHHAVVSWDDTPLPSAGDRVDVVPNHVCTAVNLADVLHVKQDGALVDRWPVAARGANS
ncbi:D-TA family PLP-dependent enzyme [soil metagenome]